MISQFDILDYDNICTCISQLQKSFPFAEITSIGKTLCKRDIFSMSLGSGEKAVLFIAGMSGNDLLTPALLLRFFERLCISMKNDLKISAVKTSNILKEQRIIIIPLANPDGLQISLYGPRQAKNYSCLVSNVLNGSHHSEWRSNARGVEPYFNFNYDFSPACTHNKPTACKNYGPYPESEVETRAITEFIKRSNIKYSLLLSANGEGIIHSPRLCNSENALMAQIFKSISGFPVKARDEKTCKGNFCEWFLQNYNRLSFEFSFENEKNFNYESIEKTYQAQEELLMLSAIM